MILASLFNCIWDLLSLFNPVIKQVEGVSVYLSFIISSASLGALVSSVIMQGKLLFGSSSSFRKIALKVNDGFVRIGNNFHCRHTCIS